MQQESKKGAGVSRLLAWMKQEVVLTAAVGLAVISAFFVPPDAVWLEYIDWNTICLLFSLMCVVAGVQKLGVFRAVSLWLLTRAGGRKQLEGILVALPFFFSMLITNDVALITFVPFALVVLRMAEAEEETVKVLVLQTLAANLGSMLTPIGNPQNLYLFLQSGMGLGEFMAVTAPYTLLSGVCLLLAISLGRSNPPCRMQAQEKTEIPKVRLLVYLLLFVLCLLTVARLLPSWLPAAAAVLVVWVLDRRIFRSVDYSLLATFAGFFIFIGNMERLPAFRSLISALLEGRERLTSVLLSQVISNVPAAMLLSGFTREWRELLIGVNLGGLGTLIASMASLITYKQVAAACPEKKGSYFACFTAANVVMLAILYAASLLLTGGGA